MALKVYKGEVPISPYTIPRLINKPPADSFVRFLCSDTINEIIKLNKCILSANERKIRQSTLITDV